VLAASVVVGIFTAIDLDNSVIVSNVIAAGDQPEVRYEVLQVLRAASESYIVAEERIREVVGIFIMFSAGLLLAL
jgi:hypothetical protein